MEPGEFRKLNIDLPLQPIVDDHPWFIAGLLLAFAFILMIVYAFLLYKGIL
jgi:hypothetical protein